jgi:hypothetical protein
MADLWVWRHDGTLQCGLGNEETLEEAHQQLATIIGNGSILAEEKRTLPSMIISLCGAPTGQANAFQLTEEGYWLLFHGIVGPVNFRPWLDEPAGKSKDETPFPSIQAADLAATLKHVSIAGTRGVGLGHIEDLYGHECRVYKVGDALTKDFRPERFNVGLDDGRMKEIWFG